jgi:peptidoglycan/xylan/chitin deacetylase (PgdA/CDA1 family)
MEMPTAPAAADWTQYNASFQVPAGAVSLTIFHMISRAGTLQVDDYAIEPYKVVGFNQGLVTLTFDDSWEINASTALPIMQKYGVKSNQFYATTFMQNPSVPNSKTTMNKFVNAGHEMGSHSITHPDLTTLSASKLESELRDSQTYMRSYFPGHKINYFATPYGAYNANVKARIMNYYTVHRTVDTGYNSKDNFDVSRLKVQNVLNTTTPAEVDGWVKKAKADKTWLVLVYHRVATNPGPYDTTITGFDSQMKAVKASGVPVKTITGALTEINPQLSR